MNKANLAIIIVSYNTCDLLRNCLGSLQRAAASEPQLTLQMIVVDNASHDDSAAMVKQEFPLVHLIDSAENLGFTRANNLALRRLGFAGEAMSSSDWESEREGFQPPDFVLLLNPDTTVEASALGQMVHCLQSSPAAGGCGAHLRYEDGTFQHGAFHFPTLAQVTLDLFPLHQIRGMHRAYNGKLNGRYAHTLWEGATPFPVEFVLGAALMVKAEVIRQVGLLDEGFFMYCEEMDWCLRIQKAGWQILAVPSAHIIHYEGRSSRQVRWASFTRLWKSRLRFYEKHGDRYPTYERLAIHALLRSALLWRKRDAQQRFAQGKVDGVSFAAEIAAYNEVLKSVVEGSR